MVHAVLKAKLLRLTAPACSNDFLIRTENMMSDTTLTIGMAHHSDFDGVFFTTQALRMYHPEILSRTDLVVIDNSPTIPGQKDLETLVTRMKSFFRDARYIPYPGSGGPALSKGRVFAASKTDAVLCMDCHVFLDPGSLKQLLDFYDANPGTQDLYHGPLMADDPATVWTHFDNLWRGQMWGTWGVAWRCLACGQKFSILNTNDQAEYRSLVGNGSEVVTSCCCKPLPVIPWQGHELPLTQAGYMPVAFTSPGKDDDLDPFEIPAQGMGLFTCRKDAWLGFNDHFSGFGGEEFYIHEKFRKAGRKAMCLPFLRWMHRFARPNGPKYAVRTEDRVRNYVLGHNELGLDLTDCKTHFLSTGLPSDTWDAIVSDPIKYGRGGGHKGTGCQSCKKEIEPMDLDKVFTYYSAKVSDFNQHFDAIRKYASLCEHVTEFGARDSGVIALLAGKPKELRSYNSQMEGAGFWKAEQLGKDLKIAVTISHEEPADVEIEPTDLLFYDPMKSDLFGDLERNYDKLRRFVVVHDTDIYGVKMPDGRPGLKIHLMHFMKVHPEWTVVYSTTNQYGLMVLSKNPEDKPKRPGVLQMGPTFLKHMTEYVMDKATNVTAEHLDRRLQECWLCDLRTDKEQCSLCGCPLVAKAKMRAMRCDANKWEAVDAQFKSE